MPEHRHQYAEHKDLRQDAEALQFWTKVVNIAAVPLLVTLFGIGLALRTRRRAVRQAAPAAAAGAAA